MASTAAICSPIFESCNGFGAIQTQRCQKVKVITSLNISQMRTRVFVGSGKGGFTAFNNGVETQIQKGCKKTLVSVSTTRAAANQVQKIESEPGNGLSTESGEISTNIVKENIPSGFGHLWTQCNSCYGLNYKKHLSAKMFICEHCGEYLKMSSSDRIDFLIESNTWTPRDEDMIFVDTYGFESKPKSAAQ